MYLVYNFNFVRTKIGIQPFNYTNTGGALSEHDKRVHSKELKE